MMNFDDKGDDEGERLPSHSDPEGLLSINGGYDLSESIGSPTAGKST